MNIRHFSSASLVATVLAGGCGSSAQDTSPTTVTQWLGEAPHFAASGQFNGSPMNVRLEGQAAMDPTNGVKCARDYGVRAGAMPKADGTYDPDQLYFALKEIAVVVPVDGTPTQVSFGYWGHDPAAGETFEVVPRVRGTSVAPGQAWVDFQLADPSTVVGNQAPNGVEIAAESGTLKLELNSTPATGYVPTGGRTGVFVDLTFGPEEHLKVSATSSDCVTQIAPWAPFVVLP